MPRISSLIPTPFRPVLGFSLCLAMFLSACGGKTSEGGGPSSGSSSSSSSSSSSTSSSSSSSSSTSSSSGGVASTCLQPALDTGYCLVWQDEFSFNALDRNQWSSEVNCWGGGNNEAQCYLDRPENLWTDGDYLHLKAIREDVNGPAVVDDDPAYSSDDTAGSGTYSSARIRSKNKGDWRYGRFEIRAKLPAGQGTWSAIWMLPTDSVYGGWASSGEIDIMEAVNLTVGGESEVHGTLHFGDNWPNNVYAGEAYLLPDGTNPADDFHEYAIEWEQGEMRWYVDGKHYATQTQDGWYTQADLSEPAAPFNQRFHLLLNFAVGGDWAGNVNDTGIDEAAFPQEMIVDYVRVYECTHDPLTGRGCATRDDDIVVNPGVAPPEPTDVTGDTVTLFDGVANASFAWGVYSESGDIEYRLVDAGGEFGTAAEITFATDNGIGFFQSTGVSDLSEYSTIEFDLRVVEDLRNLKAPLLFRADCRHPCTSGDVDLGYPELNVWTHYEVPLQSLASAGLDLERVDTPFVISSEWGNQAGLKLMLDNVTIRK